MGYARLALSPDFLVVQLRLPTDTRIVAADMDHSHGDVVLTVVQKDLKSVRVAPGERWPTVRPTFKTCHVGDQPFISFIGWGQD